MADIVPAFGLPQYKEALQRFPTLLMEVLDILKLRFPEVTYEQQCYSIDTNLHVTMTNSLGHMMMLKTSVAKLQSFAVDLLISELVSVPEDVDSSTSLNTTVDRIIRFVKVSRQITRKTTCLTIN